jgi:hypothetical protein
MFAAAIGWMSSSGSLSRLQNCAAAQLHGKRADSELPKTPPSQQLSRFAAGPIEAFILNFTSSAICFAYFLLSPALFVPFKAQR